MPRDELPSLKDLIARTPAAQSRDAARAHLAKRRSSLGLDNTPTAAARQVAAEAMIGHPEPLPATECPANPSASAIDDPEAFARQFWEKRRRSPAAKKKTPAKTPTGKKPPHLTIIEGDKTKE